MYRVRNLKYNTEPFLVHNPFCDLYECELWNRLVGDPLPIAHCRLPNNITFVTWNHQPRKELLEKQLDRLKIEYVCLGKGLDWNSNRLKPITLAEWIDQTSTEYILGADCYDVLVVRSLEKIVESFLDMNAKLVYNATSVVFPESHSHKDAEIRLCPNPPFQFFNSGLFLGETEYLRWLLGQIPYEDINHPLSDQYLIRQLYHRHYPEIQLDYGCNLFQIMYLPERSGYQTGNFVCLCPDRKVFS